MTRRLVKLVLGLGVLVGLTTAAALGQGGYPGGGADYGSPPAAGKAQTQLATAIQHARFSAGANATAGAVTHLGHTLNCIEGARGKNFNAAWGHVCQGQGDGILVDIRGERNAAAVMLVLEAANDLAVRGVKAQNVAAVQNAARGVAALLQIVVDGLK
jgi:hypothetical protein